MNMETKVKNMLITDERENTLVYCLTLTEDELRQFCETCDVHPTDICEIRDDEIQYYVIDGRVWIDTPEKEAAARRRIA